MGDTILVADQGDWVEVTLNRPDRLNSFTEEMHLALRAALDSAAGKRCVLLTGAGRGFCAGQDLGDRDPSKGELPNLGETLKNYFNPNLRLIRDMPKPVVAAVNGAAVAGGLEISLACDMLVAGSGVVFSLPEVKRGMVAFTGGVQRLSTQLSRQIAMEIICMGSLIPAERMYELGVVNRVVPQHDVLPAALALADDLLANSWKAIAFGKELFNHAMNEPLPDAIARGHANADRLMRSDDSREGIAAYAEKRDADFKKEQA